MVNLTPVPEAKGEEAEIAGLGTDTAPPTEAPGCTEELLGAESADIEFNTTLLFIGPDGQAIATLKGPGTNGTKIPLVASGFPKGNVNVSVSVNGATLDPAKNQYKVAGAVSPGKVKGTNFQFQVELLIDVPAGAAIKILVYSGKDQRSITYQVKP